MQNNHFQIIGHRLCPYVQRVMILASEKKIKITRKDIELHNKPDWFIDLSPTGKVPILLLEDGTVIFESNVICDYLDEVSLGSLFPKDLKERALCRSWLQFGTDILNDIAALIYNIKTFEEYENGILKIRGKLAILEKIHSDQTYFLGETFYLVDAVFATVFRYFAILKIPLNGFNFFKDFPRLGNWNNVLFQRQSVKEVVPEDYNSFLIIFIKRQNSYLSKFLNTSV